MMYDRFTDIITNWENGNKTTAARLLHHCSKLEVVLFIRYCTSVDDHMSHEVALEITERMLRMKV